MNHADPWQEQYESNIIRLLTFDFPDVDPEYKMTESEWTTSSLLWPMLFHLKGTVSARKLRLFSCACCRRIWEELPCEENRQLVLAIENWPDLTFNDPEIYDAAVASSSRERMRDIGQ